MNKVSMRFGVGGDAMMECFRCEIVLGGVMGRHWWLLERNASQVREMNRLLSHPAFKY